MSGKLTFAHLGSVCFFLVQCLYALRRHSSKNSGSLFLLEINRTISSLIPFSAMSDSISVTNPYLYSESSSDWDEVLDKIFGEDNNSLSCRILVDQFGQQ